MDMDYLNLGHCFSVLHRRSQIFIVTACERLQITYSEYVLLLRLYEREGVSQEQLANLLFLDKAVVTRTMGLLEKKGLIRREQDVEDRRVKRVYLTERAMEEKEYLLGVLRAWMQYLSKDFGEEELKLLVQGFESIAHRAAEANIQGLARIMEEYQEEKIFEGNRTGEGEYI